MPVDAGLYSQFAPQVLPPQAYTNALMQQDAARQSQQMNALHLQQGQQSFADEQALRKVLQGGADLSTQEGMAAATQAAPLQAQKLREMQLGMAKTQAETDKAAATAAKDRYAVTQEKVQANASKLLSVNTPDQAHQWIDAAVQRGDLPPEAAAQEHAQVPSDPSQIAAYKQAKMMEAVKVHDALTLAQQRADEQGRNTRNAADQATRLKVVGIEQSGANARNAATITGENVRAGVNADGSPLDGAGLSEQAREAAAARYRIDGTLPTNVGRGTQGARDMRDILNRAAKQAADAGDTPEAQRIGQIINKGNTVALTKLTQQQNIVGAAEKNFQKNADLVLGQSDKVGRTGVPVINAWINAGKRSVAGDPDVAAFDAVVKATVNEYAKIVSGGAGNAATAEGEIHKIEGILAAKQTPQQVKAVIDMMRKETANRMASFEDQKSELTSSMVRPHASPVAKPAAGKVVNFADLK